MIIILSIGWVLSLAVSHYVGVWMGAREGSIHGARAAVRVIGNAVKNAIALAEVDRAKGERLIAIILTELVERANSGRDA